MEENVGPLTHPLSNGASDTFDPKRDLDFTPPPKIYTMSELSFPEGTGISFVAVSEPFQLFTLNAVRRMRSEILSQVIWDTARYSSNLSGGKSQLRGYASKHAPFVYDTWKNAETLSIVSKIAGVDLIPEMDFEIAHINLSMGAGAQYQDKLIAYRKRKAIDVDEVVASCSGEDDAPVVDWHTDSYPFVCVTMLSDCTNMIGGETALRTGDGKILKIRAPQMGCSFVLQGRCIEHRALRALGSQERITMVTSFRPRDLTLRDDTVLTTVRPISDLSELYFQFGEYRLKMLEERIRIQVEKMREAMQAGKKTDVTSLKRFLREQEDFLAHTDKEIVEEEYVIKGNIDDGQFVMNRGKRQRLSTVK